MQIKLFKVFPKLVLEKGRVWYLQQSEGSKDKLLFMVPACDISSTITSIHDSETGGHLGIDMTMDKIKSRFYWVGMASDVKRHVLSCYFCQAS